MKAGTGRLPGGDVPRDPARIYVSLIFIAFRLYDDVFRLVLPRQDFAFSNWESRLKQDGKCLVPPLI